MPKIIDDIKNTILLEARAQALKLGYTNMTIRSVAASCHVAVGTIYNYFPSKDMLIASLLLDDWQKTIMNMRSGCELAQTSGDAFRVIWDRLREYNDRYTPIFRDSGATKRAVSVFGFRHKQLRSQITEIVRQILIKYDRDDEFLSEFISEALLTWALEDKNFSDVNNILCRLI